MTAQEQTDFTHKEAQEMIEKYHLQKYVVHNEKIRKIV
jgi:hypothetical protein